MDDGGVTILKCEMNFNGHCGNIVNTHTVDTVSESAPSPSIYCELEFLNWRQSVLMVMVVMPVFNVVLDIAS